MFPNLHKVRCEETFHCKGRACYYSRPKQVSIVLFLLVLQILMIFSRSKYGADSEQFRKMDSYTNLTKYRIDPGLQGIALVFDTHNFCTNYTTKHIYSLVFKIIIYRNI
jgi:hypothetical protein